MALNAFTVSTDFVGKGKRLASWHFSAAGTAIVANFRNGGAAGPIQWQVQIPINASASQAYSNPAPLFTNSLYVEIVSGAVNAANVDLI